MFTPSDAADYSIITNAVSVVVSPAPLTVTANSRIKTYGQTVTFSGTEFAAVGLVNGDVLNDVTLTSSGAIASAAVGGSPYGVVPSGAVGSGLANYAITYISGALTVNPATLTVTANNHNKSYGQLVTFAGTEVAMTGLLNGDTVTGVTLTSPGTTATATVAGSPYNIVPSAASGTGLANYTISYNNGTLTVNPASLTITANNRAKSYGQSVTFSGTEYTATGLLNGDSITAVILASFGGAANAAVSGSPYTIIPTAATGNGLGNYTIAYNIGLLTINQAALTITANNRSKTYGHTTSFAGTEFTAAGLQNGDTVTGVTLTSSGAAANATVSGSAYAIVPSAAVGSGLGNYAITYANGGFTVNPAALTITANNRGKTYGQTVNFAGTEFTVAGLLNSDTVTGVTLASSGAAANAAASSSPYTIVPAAATGTSLGNYIIAYNAGALTVSQAALIITASNKLKPYGQSISFAGTEFTAGGLQNSDTVTSVTLTSSGTTATATVGGSPYSIIPSAAVGTGLINYAISYVNGNLTINPASLTITANNRTKTYGQIANLAGTEFTMAGLLNSDTVTSVTLTSSGAAATATVSGSSYPIVPSAAVGSGLGNYAITYANGSFTVNAALLTITADNRSKTYGQTMSFTGTEFTVAGLQNNDTATGVILASSGAASTATVGGSPYSIVPSAAVGAGLGNYIITYANGSLMISPATLTITAGNRVKTYGQTVNFVGNEFTVVGLLNSDKVNGVTLVSFGAVANAAVSGSPYAIIPSAATGTGLANYTIAYNAGTLTVSLAPLIVTANSRTKTYGQSVSFSGTEFATSGLQNSDAVTSVTLTSSGAAPSATVGGSPYSIIPSAAVGAGLSNYTITYANGGLTIDPASLTITANNRTKTYGQTANFAGTEFTVAGLLNSDTVTSVTLTSVGTAATATVAGSPYPIVPSVAAGFGLANYAIMYINGTLTVTEAGATITWTSPAPITYGAALSGKQLNATANVPGSFTYIPTNSAVINTGTNVISVIFNPTDTEDYSNLTATVSLLVLPAPLTVAAPSAIRVYSQPNPPLTGIITGLTNGDNITAVYGTSATTGSPPGAYPIVPILVDPNNRQTNYSITLGDGLLTILQATPVVTWTNPAPTTYGAALGSNQLSAVAAVPGNFTYSPELTEPFLTWDQTHCR